MVISNAAAILVMMASTANGQTTIPRPDGIVVGTVYVDGAPLQPNADCVVLARVEDRDQPVAVYRLGDLPAAGNAYVLHFPHAMQGDGVTPAPDAPTANTPAQIYVIAGRGPETLAGEVLVPASGKTLFQDLRVSANDLEAGRPQAVTGADGCGNGGLCGTIGMVNLLWITLGLASMKAANRHRRRRR